MEAVIQLLAIPLVLWIVWILFAEVGNMAERRGQDRLLWQIAALLINPFTAMVLLWLFVSKKEGQGDG